jgi:repressor LexA
MNLGRLASLGRLLVRVRQRGDRQLFCDVVQLQFQAADLAAIDRIWFRPVAIVADLGFASRAFPWHKAGNSRVYRLKKQDGGRLLRRLQERIERGLRIVDDLPRLDLRLSFAYIAAMLPLTKRQREILDYLNEFIAQHGYAPSLEEIGRRFGLSSLATVHKHLTNLQEKGFIKRAWNRSRSVEMMPTRTGGRAVELPLLGYVAAGLPIEAVASNETFAVPEDFVGKRDTYVLRVRGDSMIDEQIRDGDFVVVEDRKTADNGEMVIALLRGSDVTLKKFYRDPGGKIRLQPANAAMQPIFADPDQVQIQGVVIGVMRKY